MIPLPIQVRALLLKRPHTAAEMAQVLNQPLADMRRILALMTGLELGDDRKPLPAEVHVIDRQGHYELTEAGRGRA